MSNILLSNSMGYYAIISTIEDTDIADQEFQKDS